MAKKPAPRDADQIRRETARLHAAKGAAMRDLKAIGTASAKKLRRASRAAQGGIRMGSR